MEALASETVFAHKGEKRNSSHASFLNSALSLALDLKRACQGYALLPKQDSRQWMQVLCTGLAMKHSK